MFFAKAAVVISCVIANSLLLINQRLFQSHIEFFVLIKPLIA